MKPIKGPAAPYQLPITWIDEAMPQVVELRPALPQMRTTRPSTAPLRLLRPYRRPFGRGFTLIELLVVIAIIAILAGLILPTVALMKKKAKIKAAKTDAVMLAQLVAAYQADYTVAPVSTNLAAVGAAPVPANAEANANSSLTNGNAELMLILMDVNTGNAPPNPNGLRNPQHHNYATSLHHAANSYSQGLDLNTPNQPIFRDPWGNPYIVSFDLNFDNLTDDPVYGKVQGSVLVWSRGPDGLFQVPTGGANPETLPLNKDNILHWK